MRSERWVVGESEVTESLREPVHVMIRDCEKGFIRNRSRSVFRSRNVKSLALLPLSVTEKQ